MQLKIHGGTAPGNSDSICQTCRYATIIRGARFSEEVIECSQLREDTRVNFAVKTCSIYSDRSMPSLAHMEDIAWILRTDVKRKQLGFVRSSDLRFAKLTEHLQD